MNLNTLSSLLLEMKEQSPENYEKLKAILFPCAHREECLIGGVPAITIEPEKEKD